jgi:hypothetical protein
VYRFRRDQNHTPNYARNDLLPPLYIVEGFLKSTTKGEQMNTIEIISIILTTSVVNLMLTTLAIRYESRKEWEL